MVPCSHCFNRPLELDRNGICDPDSRYRRCMDLHVLVLRSAELNHLLLGLFIVQETAERTLFYVASRFAGGTEQIVGREPR